MANITFRGDSLRTLSNFVNRRNDREERGRQFDEGLSEGRRRFNAQDVFQREALGEEARQFDATNAAQVEAQRGKLDLGRKALKEQTRILTQEQNRLDAKALSGLEDDDRRRAAGDRALFDIERAQVHGTISNSIVNEHDGDIQAAYNDPKNQALIARFVKGNKYIAEALAARPEWDPSVPFQAIAAGEDKPAEIMFAGANKAGDLTVATKGRVPLREGGVPITMNTGDIFGIIDSMMPPNQQMLPLFDGERNRAHKAAGLEQGDGAFASALSIVDKIHADALTAQGGTPNIAEGFGLPAEIAQSSIPSITEGFGLPSDPDRIQPLTEEDRQAAATDLVAKTRATGRSKAVELAKTRSITEARNRQAKVQEILQKTAIAKGEVGLIEQKEQLQEAVGKKLTARARVATANLFNDPDIRAALDPEGSFISRAKTGVGNFFKRKYPAWAVGDTPAEQRAFVASDLITTAVNNGGMIAEALDFTGPDGLLLEDPIDWSPAQFDLASKAIAFTRGNDSTYLTLGENLQEGVGQVTRLGLLEAKEQLLLSTAAAFKR